MVRKARVVVTCRGMRLSCTCFLRDIFIVSFTTNELDIAKVQCGGMWKSQSMYAAFRSRSLGKQLAGRLDLN